TEAARKRGFTDIEARIRDRWVAAVEKALAAHSVSFATMSIDTLLYDREGYLAALSAKGYRIQAPDELEEADEELPAEDPPDAAAAGWYGNGRFRGRCRQASDRGREGRRPKAPFQDQPPAASGRAPSPEASCGQRRSTEPRMPVASMPASASRSSRLAWCWKASGSPSCST